MRKADKILIVSIMIACLVLIIPIMQNAPVSKEAVVQVKNKEVLRFSLLENANYAVDGTLGKVSIEVKDGAVRVKQENSPHHYCSKQGFVDSVNTPIVMVVPGYKIGIANIVSLFALYAYSPKDMVIVTTGRIFLASLLQGTLFSIAFLLSVSGGLLSMFAMILAYRSKIFSIYGVSVLGACFHNVGQVLAITYIYQQYFMQLFLPILLALSIVSGLCIALLTRQILLRMKGKLGLWKTSI